MRRLLPLLLLSLAAAVAAQPAPDPAELKRLDAAIVKVQADLARMRNQRGDLHADVLAREREIRDIRQDIARVEERMAEEEVRLAALDIERTLLEVQRREQQALIATYLKSAWQGGGDAGMKLLLNQEDPLRSARLLRYYGYFNAARAEKITAFEATLARLEAVGIEMTTTRASLSRRQQDLQQRHGELEAGQQEREASLARLDQTLASRGAELERLEDEKIELQILLEELQRSLAELVPGDDMEPFARRKGQLSWPLEGRVLQAFGSRHNLGDLTREGVTLAGAAGADVRAIHHGRVVFADWFNTSGLLLIIDHGDGYMSLYAHTQELYRAVGDWVRAGDTIAAVGNTGGQREYGLYFEIRHNGKAENPANWCVAR